MAAEAPAVEFKFSTFDATAVPDTTSEDSKDSADSDDDDDDSEENVSKKSSTPNLSL